MSNEYPTESIQLMSFINSWFNNSFGKVLIALDLSPLCSQASYPSLCPVPALSVLEWDMCCCDALLLTKPKALLAGADCSPIALAVLLLRHFIAFVDIDLLLEKLEPNISFHENVQEKNLFRNDKLQNYSLTNSL